MAIVTQEPPSVTVVVPTKDRSELLAVTLDSLCRQTGVDAEVVVVDDGSLDATPQLLAGWRRGSVRVLRNERSLGVSEARNRGVAAARGAWIAFCDDDDVWAPDKLRSQLDAAAEAGRGWALGGVINFEPVSGVLLSLRPLPAQELARQLPWRNLVPGGCSNVVVRADLLATTGGFYPGLRVLADWDLWLRLLRTGPPAVVDAPLVGYRMHASSMSSDPGGLRAELREISARTADLRGGASVDAGWMHRWSGQTALRAGRRRDATAAFLRAARAGDWSSLARVGMAVLGPRATVALMQRRHPVDARYEQAARGWLPDARGKPAGRAA